jgi:multidrug efflux system membrane fusion protein
VDQDQRFVWVLKPDDSVEYRLIKPGSRRGSDRVVLEGLSQGDWVITEGLQKIRPGMTVKPERLAATPAG